MLHIKTLLRAAVAIGVATFGLGAYSATNSVTISFPASVNCSFSNNTLSCSNAAGGGTASCTINGNSTGVIGDTITLTGSCTTAAGAADTATWGGCGTQTATSCSISSPNTITLTGAAGGSASKVVTFGDATCSISPSNPVVTAGNSQTFNASCNFTPASYSWTGACVGASSSCTITPTAGGSLSLNATKGNTNASASTSFTVQAGGGGGSIPATCTDGTASVIGGTVDTFNGLPLRTKIKAGQTAVFPIVIPAGLPNIKVGFFEWGDNVDSTPRSAWISKTPCYATPTTKNSLVSGSTHSSLQIAYSTPQGTIGIVVGGKSGVTVGRGPTFSLGAQPGETWYLMVQTTGPGCAGGSCNVSVAPSLN
jgi:hypothetical protein